MNEIDKKKYKELKEQYHELQNKYFRDKYTLKDKRKHELEDLKDQYKIDRLSLYKPLKAEKYRIKIEKKKRNRLLNEAPKRHLLEEIGSAITHGIGVIIGIVFLILMILKANGPWAMVAAITYGTCFILQMLFSCLYHSFRNGTKVKRIFRRFDYSSIYLQIGGSFAPLWLIYMENRMWGLSWGITLFFIQWALIIMGITFVSIFGPGRHKWIHFTLYFVIGWSAIIFIPSWIQYDLPLLFWILGGGVIYSLGMIPFAALRKKPTAHFIWHFVVLIGAIFMWIGMYLYIF